ITAARLITSTAGISARSRIRWSDDSSAVGLSVMPARLPCATVPANARDSKWSPTPTAGHVPVTGIRRLSGPVTGAAAPVLRSAQAADAAIGRHRALHAQGLFAGGGNPPAGFDVVLRGHTRGQHRRPHQH